MYYKITFPNIYSKVFAVVGLILALILFDCKGYAQSLGDPIVNITFGSGSAIHSGPLAIDSGSTTYIYSGTGFPNDGYYTIANTTSGMLNTWYTTTDHTGNAGGYMMIVNGSYDPGVFYTRTVQGLCGNTKYQFAAWIKNLLNINGILPNISFSIETTNGIVLGSGNTGNIAMGNTWIQYPFTFTTPPATQAVVIKMTNNAPGGSGNDIAIDDITFRAYGAQVSAVFNQAATSQFFCSGTTQTVTINTTTTLIADYLQKVQQLVNNVWTDQTPASTASSFTITSPATAGTYYYRLASAQTSNINTSSCVVASNQLTITVNPTPTAKFAVPVNTCLGSPTKFTDQSLTNGGTIRSWLWDFGDGQTSTLQSPSHIYVATGNYTIQLTLTNSNGCTSVATPQIIHVGSVPVASFNYSTPDCTTKAVTLTDQSAATDGNIITWLWDYGDGTTDTKQNSAAFQHSYAIAGSYTVKLTITTDKGCSVTAAKNITISPTPVVNFGTPDVCLADAFASFTDSTTIADNSNSQFTYLWNFGDANASATRPNTSTLKNPVHKYIQAAIYQVSLTVTSNNGCSATVTKSFTVNGSIPVAAFTVLNPNELCSNREVLFSNQSTVNFGNITKIEMYYDYGNNPTVVETDSAPYYNKLYRHTYPQFHTGTKNYQVRMLAYSGGTCIAVADKTITLLATPLLTFLPLSAICLNTGKIQLTAAETSGIAGSGIYTGTGVSKTGLFDPATSGTGTFAIKYIYTSTNTCADTVSQNITVNAIPTANAGTNVTVLDGGSVNLQGIATGDGLTYSWYPTTNLSNSTVLDPMVTPTADMIYTLTVTNNLGCAASSQVKVSILKSPVIPNTFTPNGDGVNDTWAIKYLESYSGATVEVFNRYGQRVYYSIGYTVAWDGRFNNADLPAGVYYYLINPKHGRKAFSGWVSIIR